MLTKRDELSDFNDFQRVDYPAGTTIIEEGEEGEAVYLITHGKVEIRTGTRSNNPRIVTVLGKGEVFGELAVFDGSSHMATAIAREPTQLLAISKEEFQKRMASTDPVVRGVVMQMVKRVRQASRGSNQPLGQAV